MFPANTMAYDRVMRTKSHHRIYAIIKTVSDVHHSFFFLVIFSLHTTIVNVHVMVNIDKNHTTIK